MSRDVFGIDLGTTNSVIAWVDGDGRPVVIRYGGGDGIMPSMVGLDGSDALVVGEEARNQYVLRPDQTIRSIKRRMGNPEPMALGPHSMTPPEVSALILKELARRAHEVTGVLVREVVITVPAYFADAQRRDTRIAGEIAGLEVLRVVNEPTAAALAYGVGGEDRDITQLVYDLGGGTFDVSIVTAAPGGIAEVLASEGDVQLGGDDFDDLLLNHLADAVPGLDLADPSVRARLLRCAEDTKIALSSHMVTRARAEFLGKDKSGAPLHLDVEVHRHQFEELIEPLVQKTLDRVHLALEAAGRKVDQLDEVLLVGGSTRIPMVADRLAEVLLRAPRQDVHPDLCVAEGAAALGARLAGREAGRVLVDVTPYAFGPSFASWTEHGLETDLCRPVIPRNAPLPTTRAESYFTLVDDQPIWDVCIYQGEAPHAHDNVLVGSFHVDQLAKGPAGSEIICELSLDLDGILDVNVIERSTGRSRKARFEGVTRAADPAYVEEAQRRAAHLFGEPKRLEGDVAAPAGATADALAVRAVAVQERALRVRDRINDEDRDEMDVLLGQLHEAVANDDAGAVQDAIDELEDIIYYAEEV